MWSIWQVVKHHPITTLLVITSLFFLLTFPVVAFVIYFLLWLYFEQGTTSPYNENVTLKNTGSKEKQPAMFMSAEEKATYLRSSKWKILKQATLSRDNYCCVTCLSSKNLHIHHITYIRLGREKKSDLVTLCAECHKNLHDKLGYDRTGHYPPE